MQRTLAIWLPNWPIQRLVSKQPGLAGRPVVLEVATHRGRHVAACSAAARERNVEVGMPTAEAKALANKGSDALHLQPYDPAADRQALTKLAQWLHRFSPSVGIEDGEAPDTLLLDATNLAPLFGGEQAFVEQVAQGVARLKLEARFALADNIGTAWAVAHFGNHFGNGAAAKTQADVEGLAATIVIPCGENQRAIACLPIAALRLPANIEETLHHLGVVRVAQLLALPRQQLQPRFGPLLLQRIDQALGNAAEAIEAVSPPLDFTAEWLLEHPLSSLAQTEKVVERLVRQLAVRLSAQDAGALEVACRFTFESASPITLAAGLFRPTASADHLLEILGMHLERLLLPGPVTGVTVHVARHAPLERRQRVLFEAARSLADSAPLAALVDRLAGRLGAGAVVEARLQSDAQPELAYREEPLVGGVKRKRRSRSQPSKLSPTDRPLRLLPRPAPIQALSILPDGPPLRFQTAGREHHIARHWGPERIETGWWRKRGVRRDYYRVETEEGRRFWLFRRLPDAKWFLHGVFE